MRVSFAMGSMPCGRCEGFELQERGLSNIDVSAQFEVVITTATATAASAGLYDQIIRTISHPTVWVQERIKGLIRNVRWVLMSPSLLHFTEHEWATFLKWLRHVESH